MLICHTAINTAYSVKTPSTSSYTPLHRGEEGGTNNISRREQGSGEGSDATELGGRKQCLRLERFVLQHCQYALVRQQPGVTNLLEHSRPY